MRLEMYRCVRCRGPLSAAEAALSCRSCDARYPVRNGIARFAGSDVPEEPDHPGLAASLFNSPHMYDAFVRLKTAVAKDRHLGVRELTRGCSLLNIGCGSNVEASHLEYDIHELSAFAATDLSASFVEAARAACARDDAEFCVASVENLPYPDDTFDVALIPFVLHHLPFPFESALREAMRVAKRHVIVYDHVKAHAGAMAALQGFYWRHFDGGFQYLTKPEWDAVLRPYKVSTAMRTGAIGKHVFKFVLDKC